MIPEKLNIEILTPNKKVYSEEASSVRLPGFEGYFGVFPGHTPLLATLKIGEIKVEKDGKTDYFAASGGVVEVLPGSISILVETSELAADIDKKRAAEAKERAGKRVKEGRKQWDVKRAEVALARAINRMRVTSSI
ncbi:F0F1 ATP synthase subunit epsilon [candidate division KSB1 bacterium]|nr:F0F1 ATP synthase subunit epsilon [candidate division KSB1 bacterium]